MIELNRFLNRSHHCRSRGFTLIEILIVVVILGILAAIIIPQFASAQSAARATAMRSQLGTIRSQIASWQVQHGGNIPGGPSGSVDQNGSVNGAAAPKLAAEMVCCCCALPSVTKLADRANSGSVICEATIFFSSTRLAESIN